MVSYGNLLTIKASSNGFFVKEEKVQLCAKSGLALLISLLFAFLSFLVIREICFLQISDIVGLAVML
jgi:hypothetical protein